MKQDKPNKLKSIQIETTNICNANCSFCIHNSINKFGTMSDKLFLKILHEARRIPSLVSVVPMMLGEPFCDPDIIKRLKLINKILPEKEIVLFTNGSLLTPSKIKELKKIKDLTVNFSLNGLNKEMREKLMGLDDFDYVVKMINLYEKTGKPFKVLLVADPTVSTGELNKFKKLTWKTQLVKYGNWTGDKGRGTRQSQCVRAKAGMTIMYDGRVNLCCMEYGKVIFGDLNKQTIKDVWRSPYRQMYCKAHSAGKFLLGVCNNCNYAH